MGRIDWDNSFSVHHEELDRQHQKLVGFYNELHEVLLHGSIEEAAQMREQILTNLVEYVDYHFNFEEQYLKEMGLSDFDSHCKTHRYFSAKIINLQQDILNGNLVFTSSLIKLLRNWILDHILKDDREYAMHLKS
jgi:hemerythrin